MMRHRRDDRGLTVVELGIVLFLTSIVMATIVNITISGTKNTALAVERAESAAEARLIIAEATASLRNARGQATCEAPWGAPLHECSSVVELPFTLAQADPYSVCWLTPPAAVADHSPLETPLDPPGFACLYADLDTGDLLLERWAPSEGATYTTPDFEEDPFERRLIGTIDLNAGDLFIFIDYCGEFIDGELLLGDDDPEAPDGGEGGEEGQTDCMGRPVPTHREALVNTIAVVVLDTEINVEGSDANARVSVFIAPRGAFFDWEREWGLGL